MVWINYSCICQHTEVGTVVNQLTWRNLLYSKYSLVKYYLIQIFYLLMIFRLQKSIYMVYVTLFATFKQYLLGSLQCDIVYRQLDNITYAFNRPGKVIHLFSHFIICLPFVYVLFYMQNLDGIY